MQCVVTSPPYWGLRDYKIDGQLGLESTPEEYVSKMVEVFREIRRVLRLHGTLLLNMGDAYCHGTGKDRLPTTTKGIRVPASWSNRSQPQRIRPVSGLKPKDLVGIPWRVAFALQADGWYLRSDIIWSKPNPMPESVQDRPTRAHEYLFLLTKHNGKPLWWKARDTGELSQAPDFKQKVRILGKKIVPRWMGLDYYSDADAIKEPAIYFEEAKWDPGTDGLGGSDRKTGKSTRRFKQLPESQANIRTLRDQQRTHYATPTGWDLSTGAGAHDKKHGRYEGEKFQGMSRNNKGLDKQRGHSRRHAGFNDRWDQMEKQEQCSGMRNKRSVWTVSTQPIQMPTSPRSLRS